MKKRKIILDVDDVLGEFAESLNIFYNERHGTKFTLKDYTYYEFGKIWGCNSKEVKNTIFDFYRHSSLMDIKPLKFSQDILRILYESGESEFVAGSYRPGWIEDKTRKWIRENFFDMKTQCMGYGHKKSKLDLCKEESAEIIIEDSLLNVLECANSGINAILIDRPWNQTNLENGFHRVKDWSKVLDYI